MTCRSVASLICGKEYTLCLSRDSTVYSFGYSIDGEHGHDEEEDVFPPKIISSMTHIKLISVGFRHSTCLDSDGNIFSFGDNYYGQLGIGVDGDTLDHTHIPQKVNLPPCIQISCGEFFTICLLENGELYSFGDNHAGQLGLGNIGNTTDFYTSPQLISSLQDVEFIECNGHFAFCKTLNNEVFCWGYNYFGVLGLGNREVQNVPVLCTSLLNENVIDIKGGENHILVLTSNGDVLSCGKNEFGQLGRESDSDCSSTFKKVDELSEITRIECRRNSSTCIDINSDLFVFGYNKFGQLGLGDDENRNKPIRHPSLSNIIDISKGGNHTFVKTSNNEIYAFGKNDSSQLGIKTKDKWSLTYEKIMTPIRVFEDNEDIWYSNIGKSKAKSARK